MDIFDRLSEDWSELNHIVIYGYGKVGKRSLKKLREDFTVDYCIDKNTVDAKEHDIIVLPPDEGIRQLEGRKLIVSTGTKIYAEIAQELHDNYGLIEYRDFCSLEHLLSEWYWKYKKKNCILEVHTAITTKCTLNCKNCNMFIPYYKENIMYSFDEFRETVDVFFHLVDYVFTFVVLGGEPLVNPEYTRMMAYVGEQYGSRIGTLKTITNGMLFPSAELIDIWKRYEVDVSISDYTSKVDYKKRLNELIDILNCNGITYSVNPTIRWCDFGFPEKPFRFRQQELRPHMLACSPLSHGINDGKYYYCHVSWSAEKCGNWDLCSEDYIDMRKLEPSNERDRRSLVYHSMGNIEGGAISLCRVCGGCGFDNPYLVDAGVQAPRDKRRIGDALE